MARKTRAQKAASQSKKNLLAGVNNQAIPAGNSSVTEPASAPVPVQCPPESPASSTESGPPKPQRSVTQVVAQAEAIREELALSTPADAKPMEKYFQPMNLAARKGFNTTGSEHTISVNLYPIIQYPTKNVYQYNVLIGNGDEKRIINDKVWRSKARKALTGPQFIFDGKRLAWSLRSIQGEKTIDVDLDLEEGRTQSTGKNVFRLAVRQTKTVNLAVVMDYVKGNTSFNKDALEGLNFLDHLIREYPSSIFLAIKRSYFSDQMPQRDIGGGAVAYKGIYQAIKVVHPGRLSLNIDVSNTCFWAKWSLHALIKEYFNINDFPKLTAELRPEDDKRGRKASPKFNQLNQRLTKLRVKADYKGCPCPDKEWTVKRYINASAREWSFDLKDKATGATRKITIANYFKEKYNYHLQYADLPLVEMTKKGVIYPMEVLFITTNQRYPYKLGDLQTSAMIKFAVSPPADRRKAVEMSKKELDHDKDPVLKAFGMKISSQMIKTKVRLLPNPDIMFGKNEKINPRTFGRWDLKGKKFYAVNTACPLDSWGVGIFKGYRSPNRQQVEAFVDAFARSYGQHGGDVRVKPFIAEIGPDAADGVYKLFNQTGNAFRKQPKLLLFIVTSRDSFHYLRIKKSCDCRFGVPSQVMQAAQVTKCNPQYISNVLTKVNAKLGGATARAIGRGTPNLKPYTMFIGADVSHSSPGSAAPSMAAMTMSYDTYGAKYLAGVQTNGQHVEMITEANIRNILGPLIREWMMNVGSGRVPEYLYYFRDGVSEGQFEQVLKQEVPHIRELLKSLNQNREWHGKLTVVVASKRHHIRAFPDNGDRCADRKGNPLPGLLIERDITDPHGWDFYLYSHAAIQGTSRPVHYHVLLDEMNHKPADLENMVYDHSYQYVRSTTAVSLHPAVYYAHLASNRARAHENVTASSGPTSGATIPQGPSPVGNEVAPLMPINPSARLQFSMWYI
ncbi:hypothetical protein KEM54_001460 [Ascosphaera aggregata]|nr:hypothetical protein KEM54_001460 [Ascosphaera aggregata]